MFRENSDFQLCGGYLACAWTGISHNYVVKKKIMINSATTKKLYALNTDLKTFFNEISLYIKWIILWYKSKAINEYFDEAGFNEDASTFVDSAKTSEVHLIRAVEDDHILAETSAHVLGGLCFTCSCRPSWGTAHRHAQSLSKGDVTSRKYRERFSMEPFACVQYQLNL